MFKYIAALALVAVASATQYYVEVGPTYVTVGNTQGLQVYYYASPESDVIDIKFVGPEGTVKTIQVPDIEDQSEALYQIFVEYAGQPLDYARYQELVHTIAKFVQYHNVDPAVLYAIQIVDTALFSQLFQGDFYQYIQNVLNQQGYSSWTQGSWYPGSYGSSYGGSYGSSYGSSYGGSYGSSYRYKPYGYGYSSQYGSAIQSYRPYSYGLYGQSYKPYSSGYGLYGSYGKSYGSYGPYSSGYGLYGSSAYRKPYGYGSYGYGSSVQGYGYGLGQQYLTGLAY